MAEQCEFEESERNYFLEQVHFFRTGIFVPRTWQFLEDTYEAVIMFQEYYEEQLWITFQNEEVNERRLREAEEYYLEQANMAEERQQQEDRFIIESLEAEQLEVSYVNYLVMQLDEEDKENIPPI